MRTENELVAIRGHAELYRQTWHLFESAKSEIVCAANDLYTWVAARHDRMPMPTEPITGFAVRKLYRPAVLLEAASTNHLRQMAQLGAQVKITTDEINETIVIDGRVAVSY
jgi:hypothetical protein